MTSILGRDRLEIQDLAVLQLNKPIRQANLLHSIFAVMGESNVASSPSATSSMAEQQSAKSFKLMPAYILMAEDNPMNQAIAKKMITDMGCNLTVVENGQEACDEYASHNFDVILMDIQMPIMGGLEATQKIREQERFKGRKTPIIALTAHSMGGHREMCINAGMNDYISKPVSPKSLFAVLSKFIAVDTRTQSPDSADGGESSVATSTDAVSEGTIGSAVDLSRLRDLTGNDENIIAQLIKIFIDDTDEHGVLLRTAVNDMNIENIVSEAHRIKGGAAQVGAERLRNLASTIEQMGRDDQLSDIEAIMSDFEKEYIQVHAYLVSEINT